VSRQPSAGLARITIAAPRRRVDVVLPEQVPVAELLPSLLRHAGESLADDGERHGGWLLRRADGETLETGRALAAQQIRDGEVLHLVPFRTEWPEPDYDDIAEAIASGSRRHAPPWDGHATVAFGLAAVGLVLGVGLYAVLSHGPDWVLPGALALFAAGLLSLLGVVLSRALADSRSGATLAVYALPYALVGGLLVLGVHQPLSQLTAFQWLLGSATLLLFSVLGYFGAANGGRLFVAGGLAGLLGLVGALVAMKATPAGVAAVLVAALVAAVVGFPLLAMRLGKLPLPAVPQSPADLLADPVPDRTRVFAAVARADELLTGLLIGAAVVHAVSAVVLVMGGGFAGGLLVALVALSNLLRARLFVTVRQRLPLLLAGTAGLVVLAVGGLATLDPDRRLFAGAAGALIVGGLGIAATMRYSQRGPSPYLGRAAEILDIVLIIGVVPVACAVLGLFGWVRGLGG
jgi:type VII secretion integral membrane protein EccD